MAREEQNGWKEICVLSSRIHQFAQDQGIPTSRPRETLETIKRYAIVLMECLDKLSGEEPSFLPAFASLSCTDQPTPPSSPISLSPSTSPRIPLRNRSSLHEAKEPPFVDITGDEPRVHLPPINPRPQLAQPYPLSSPPTYRRNQALGGPSRLDAAHAQDSFAQYSTNTLTANAFSQHSPRPVAFVAHSFDKFNSTHSIQPTQPTFTQTSTAFHPYPHNVPRSSAAPSAPVAIVITQPIATICEVPGFKRRGRPSTRIDNQCVECGTHRTPEWRRGEGGVHLCNACGLQYSKRVRREKAEKKRNAISAVLNLDI